MQFWPNGHMVVSTSLPFIFKVLRICQALENDPREATSAMVPWAYTGSTVRETSAAFQEAHRVHVSLVACCAQSFQAVLFDSP